MKILVRRILLAFAFLTAFLTVILAYAYFVEPKRLVINEQNLKIPNWSAKLDGFKVVAVSDIHGGSNDVTEEKIWQVVELVNRQNPDLVVLLGDFVSQTGIREGALKMPSATVISNLKGLRAKYGVFAVIGNHDWYYNDKKMAAEFTGAGIKVLENEVAPISVGGETVNLWGIEDYWKNRRVPLEAFDAIPNKQNIIAITHNPDSLLKSPNEISLMLAGHTHGGQVKIPFFGAFAFVSDRRLTQGFVEVDGRHIFVTTGIGTTGPPIRFGVPPEIAVLNLYSTN